MKVILLQDVKGSGKKGDIIEVSDGFARNCLFRKKQAIEATSTQVNAVTNKKKAEEYHHEQEILRLKGEAKKVNNYVLTTKIKCGENGKIFGSITSKEIAERLTELGFEVDKKKIVIKEPIKALGSYSVDIKYLPDTVAKISVVVESL